MTTWAESEAAKEKAIADRLTPVQKMLAEVMHSSIPTPDCEGPIMNFGPYVVEFEQLLGERGYCVAPLPASQIRSVG